MDYELDGSFDRRRVSMPSGLLALNGQQFTDFNFTPLAGFGPGTYDLIDFGSIAAAWGRTPAAQSTACRRPRRARQRSGAQRRAGTVHVSSCSLPARSDLPATVLRRPLHICIATRNTETCAPEETKNVWQILGQMRLPSGSVVGRRRELRGRCADGLAPGSRGRHVEPSGGTGRRLVPRPELAGG